MAHSYTKGTWTHGAPSIFCFFILEGGFIIYISQKYKFIPLKNKNINIKSIITVRLHVLIIFFLLVKFQKKKIKIKDQ